MERDPILFYDEVPLYESDLDDNGVIMVTAKVGHRDTVRSGAVEVEGHKAA